MKKPCENPSKVIIVHHPPVPDTPATDTKSSTPETPASQPAENVEVEPDADEKKEISK